MLNDRIATLIARKLSKEATSEELQELASHFRIHPDDQYFEDLLISYWCSQPNIPSEQTLHSDDHFKRIVELATEVTHKNSQQIEVHEVSFRATKIGKVIKLSIAAAIAGLLFIGWKFIYLDRKPASKQVSENEVMAKKGARSKLLLPDGTEVWLNSDSKLVYSNSFNDTIREVKLEGEAYFDVVKDPHRPFIVHTSAIDIRVLGTAFDVKSYPGDSTIEATLIRGLIEVTKKDQPQAPKIILRPHEKLVFDKLKQPDTKENKRTGGLVYRHDSPIAITAVPKGLPDTSIIETSWIYNKLLFEGDTFRELSKKMERWFNVTISFKDDKAANYRFVGSFTNETVEQALQELQFIFPFSYKINGNEVEIDKK
jgi:transmembrane sensor